MLIERSHATALEERMALYSECGRYRYLLKIRRLEHSRGRQLLPFIGLNPSTATELEDDATIRRCLGFARNWGYAGIQMANLAAYRATNPREMLAAVDPIGPANTPAFLRSLLPGSAGTGARSGDWSASREEARCPECFGWFPVVWQGELPPGGYWWSGDSGGCPGCGAIVLVESECDYRAIPDPDAQAVACWGIRGAHTRLLAQNAAVRRELGPWLHALGRTSNGQPAHPLYLRLDTPLQRLQQYSKPSELLAEAP